MIRRPWTCRCRNASVPRSGVRPEVGLRSVADEDQLQKAFQSIEEAHKRIGAAMKRHERAGWGNWLRRLFDRAMKAFFGALFDHLRKV